MHFKNVMQERFNPGTDLTAVATKAVTGKTFLAYSKDMQRGLISVAPAEAGAATAGVAKYDAAETEKVGVARGAARIVTVTAAGSIKPGNPVVVGENGKAAAHSESGEIVGWCVNTAEEGDDALISLAY